MNVRSVDCGDFHTAALTYSSRIFVWGACSVNIPSSSPSSSSSASATSSSSSSSATLHSITQAYKVDITSHLKGVPKQVLTCISVTLHNECVVFVSTDCSYSFACFYFDLFLLCFDYNYNFYFLCTSTSTSPTLPVVTSTTTPPTLTLPPTASTRIQPGFTQFLKIGLFGF